MTIDDAGIKNGLRQTFEEGCAFCPKEAFCMYADGWNDLARDALEYIEALESSLKEYMDMEEIRRNREHASKWVKYWREKHGQMTLTWPDWNEIYKDWEEAHALAQSRLRRMRLFKERCQRYLIDANNYKWMYADAANERDAAVKDLYHAASDGGSFCDICKYKGEACDERKFNVMECWEWRGPQEVES